MTHFFIKNWDKYFKFCNFLQTFNLKIITIASKINIIKVAVNTTCGICKIQNGRRIQTHIYNRVETLDGCQIKYFSITIFLMCDQSIFFDTNNN